METNSLILRKIQTTKLKCTLLTTRGDFTVVREMVLEVNGCSLIIFKAQRAQWVVSLSKLAVCLPKYASLPLTVKFSSTSPSADRHNLTDKGFINATEGQQILKDNEFWSSVWFSLKKCGPIEDKEISLTRTNLGKPLHLWGCTQPLLP